MERTWTGRVRPGAEAEHEGFVAWLASDQGHSFLARSLLTSYLLAEENGRVTVTLGADEPPPIVRFLRNPRFWPDFWDFESAERNQTVGPNALERVVWQKVRQSG
jgi:hypothetical protein